MNKLTGGQMTDRELMQQALEALESLHRTGDTQVFDMYDAPVLIPALRERLAQPEQEPVAWKETDEVECPVCNDKGFPWPKCGHITYLEHTPPQRTWVELTNEEMHECWGDPLTPLNMKHARMIEAKLKEKNT